MDAAVTIALGLALGVSAISAISDWRRGEIPNWLTLPPIVLAPLAYGLGFGPEFALRSLSAAVLSALVPYFLFYRGVVGGGDVKIFGALGAITGFDLLAGIEIQLAAVMVAMLAALGVLAWNGVLSQTLLNALALPFNPLLPARWRQKPCDALCAQVRMGGAIFVATAMFAAPQLARTWSAP